MRIHYLLFPSIVLVAITFSSISSAQNINQSKSIEESQKAFLINYLKAFDGFINNPNKYWDNKSTVLDYFNSPDSKRVFNIFSEKSSKKGYITPDSLVKHIYTYYPDGLGIAYSSDNFKLVGKKKNLFSKTFVYKTHIEYSGIRSDQYLLNYNDNQYFYLKSKTLKKNTPIKVSYITDKKFFQTRFKKMTYRVGFIVEPHISLIGFSVSGSSFQKDGYISHPDIWYYGDNYENYIVEFRNTSENNDFGSNIGVDVIYMFTPSFGIGTGYSNYSQTSKWSVRMQNYWGYNYMYIHSDVSGYIPDVKFDDFEQIVTISSPTNIPVFLRFHFGWRTVSLSFDLGVSRVFEPTYFNYLHGQVLYRGTSIVNNQIVYNTSSALGFGTFNYEDELVHKHKSDKNITYIFSRANFHVNLSKNFYFRISSLYHMFDKIEYNESWNMFDMYALRLKNADMSKGWKGYSMEFGIGLNINQMVLRSRFNE